MCGRQEVGGQEVCREIGSGRGLETPEAAVVADLLCMDDTGVLSYWPLILSLCL